MIKNILVTLFAILAIAGISYAVGVWELNESTVPADGDLMYTIDVSDTTDRAEGTGKYVTMDKFILETELDTESELEGQITDMTNIIQASEIDTFAEINAIVADETLVNTDDAQTLTNKTLTFGGNTITMTEAQLETAVTDDNPLFDGDIGTNVQAYDADLADLADGSLTASKVAGVADADYGDITVTSGSWAVEDDSHNHVITNIDSFTESQLYTQISDVTEFAETDEAEVITGDYDFGGGGIEIENNTTVPVSCTVGQIFLDTDATSGQQLYACESGSFVLQGDGGGGGTPGGSDTQVQFNDGGSFGGDTGLIFNKTADSLTIGGSMYAGGQITFGALTNCDTIDTDANGVLSCGTDASGSGGTANILDLGDDASNESTDLIEIATTGDTNSIFTEPTADKLLITLSNNWPSADTADALSSNPTDCSANQYANAIAANGNLTCGSISDADVPNTITIDAATNVSDADFGDVTVTSGVWAVEDDSHNHVITNIDAFTETQLETQLSDVTALFTNNVTGDVTVSGATSSITADVVDFVDINQSNTLAGNPALLVDECYFAKTTSGGGFICEGSTADTAEQLYLFPDANGSDTTQSITINTATQTLTNKTISLGSNTVTMTEAQLETAVTDDNPLFDGDIGVNVQAYDADLADLADGSLTASKVAGVADADYGEISVSGGSWSVDTNVIDGTNIALGSDAQGDVMYYDGTDWVALAAGTSGQFLQTQGAAANPQWATASGSGDITDVFNCASGDCNSIAVTDGDLLDFSNSNASSTTDGLILPQNTTCTSGTAEGQVCWDSDNDSLYVGNGSTTTQIAGGGGGGGQTNKTLRVHSAKISGSFVTDGDATQGAAIAGGEGNWRLLFDASTDEGAVWQFVMPDNYLSTPTLDVHYTMTSATANEVEFEGAIMCVSDGDSADVGTASFSTIAVGSATVPGTAGYPDVISITLTDDSCAASDMVWIYLSTDADDATNDDATGDREVIGVEFGYTGS